MLPDRPVPLSRRKSQHLRYGRAPMSIPFADHQRLNFFSAPFVTELFQRSGCVRRCRSPLAQRIHGQPSRDLGLAEEYVESRALRAAIRPTERNPVRDVQPSGRIDRTKNPV